MERVFATAGQRGSWVDEFLAFERPAHVTEDQTRHYLRQLDQILYGLWRLGRRQLVGWAPVDLGIKLCAVESWQFAVWAEAAGDERGTAASPADTLFARDKMMSVDDIDAFAAEHALPVMLEKLNFRPGRDLSAEAVSALVARYGVARVEDRAVALFDFPRLAQLPPIAQVVAVNELSCAVNDALEVIEGPEIEVQLTRTTVGDGFYLWNRRRGIDANLELFKFVLLVRACLAARHGADRHSPHARVTTAFDIGAHYEFYHAEGRTPSTLGYLVGNVGQRLRMMARAGLPEQLLIGDFEAPIRVAGGSGFERVAAPAFVAAAAGPEAPVAGTPQDRERAGRAPAEVACALTADADANPDRVAIGALGKDAEPPAFEAFNAVIDVRFVDGGRSVLGIDHGELHSGAEALARARGIRAID